MCRGKVSWRHDVPKELTAKLERKADCQETCTITTFFVVTENGCDSVGHARTSRRPAGCRRGWEVITGRQ